MQLFVVPVTMRLLTQPSRAMDTDIPFALEHHIPILPLMQEKDLDKQFGVKFGDLQYLDKHTVDATAISFDEKLTKFLQGVIVGDEIAQKVRAAFDAYIFLSYRKKDRADAQQLMRLIHDNALCRDIAIWYDEFLTPGENFIDAIRDALKKSDLFALAVTPNLVNEENYVRTTEYPMARDLGKEILPAEMQPTDREMLRDQYEELPEPVKTGGLDERLELFLRRLAITENDDDPQHNFFIGLAYLSGIDVEVNKDRAFRLIKGAAEKNHVEAIRKLTLMYENGEGVERDYHMGAKWRERLAELYKSRYESTPNEVNATLLVSSLQELGNAYYALRDLNQAKAAYKQMLRCCEDFDSLYSSPIFIDFISFCYGRLGSIAQSEGDFTEAHAHYQKSFEIKNAILKKDDTLVRRLDLSVSNITFGDLAMEMGKRKEARGYYEKALDLLDEFANNSDIEVIKNGLTVCYERLGILAEEEGRRKEAREYFQKMFEIRETEAKSEGTADSKIGLANSYGRVGNLALTEGKLGKARENFQKSIEIYEQLAHDTQTVDAWNSLSVAYINLGDLSLTEGKLGEAREYFQKALEISERLARETDTREARRNLSIAYGRLGKAYHTDGNINDALKYWQKDLSICEELEREASTPQTQRDLWVNYNNVGLCAEEAGYTALAEAYYRKGLKIAEELAKTDGALKNRMDVAMSYIKLGRVTKDTTLMDKAYDICMEVCQSDMSNVEARRLMAFITTERAKARGGLMGRLFARQEKRAEKKRKK